MSRTDKTAPSWVKVFYYPDWIEEFHDHRDGECDLPPRPRRAGVDNGFENWRHERGHCYWVASYSQFWNGTGLARCCCPMCHGYYYNYSNPRHPRNMRRAARRYCRDDWRDEY